MYSHLQTTIENSVSEILDRKLEAMLGMIQMSIKEKVEETMNTQTAKVSGTINVESE